MAFRSGRRLVGAGCLLCVGLAIAVLGAMRARALRLAAEDPWSKLPIGTVLDYGVGTLSSSTLTIGQRTSYRLADRTALTATVEEWRSDGFSGGIDNSSSVLSRSTISLGDPDRETLFESGLPKETIETPAGKFDCVRVDRITPTAHTTGWYTRELPMYVKLVIKRADSEETSTLIRVLR
jgi:hypothetical protein